MVNSPGVRAREALIARDQWGASGEGYIKSWSTGAPYIDWQFRDVPNWQRAMGDIRVRQALLHATDLEGINEAINLGFSPVVHAFISPEDPLFPEVDRVITKYAYDGNRAAALLAEAGWRRPSGGGLVTNAAGQPFDLELFTTASQQSQATIIADNWKTAGVNSTLFVVPQAQARDDELATHYTAARVNNRQLGVEQFIWTSREFSTPENRWSGSNRGSFFDPEIDHLQNLRLTSLDESERRRATVSVLRRLTELAGPTPFLYAVEVILARSYVVGPVAKLPEQGGMTWNIHEWEVTRSR
ncbi:MAG: hypothetical protein HW416_3076 [Chloroflexi bacterium]|nr:hypothetical protein [Chloroflexota bacterium]